jgi:hypothetical protein
MSKISLLALFALLLIAAGGFILFMLLPQKNTSEPGVGWRDSSYIPEVSSPISNNAPNPPSRPASTTPFEPILLPEHASKNPTLETGTSRLIEFFSGLGISRNTSPLSITEDAIPTLFDVSFASPAAPIARTVTQEMLYQYGNVAGAAILAHEEAYGNAVSIFEALFKNASSTSEKIEAHGLADSLEAIGDSLLAIPDVPSTIKAEHATLAESYRALGPLLHEVIDAKGDSARLDSMLLYNAAVEKQITAFIALTSLLSSEGIRFEKTDTGRVFALPL